MAAGRHGPGYPEPVHDLERAILEPVPVVSRWIGRICSAVVVLVLLADAVMDLLMPQKLADVMSASGFQLEQASTLGFIVLLCAVLYAIPTTAFLGAILVTGFWGGAFCTHLRIGEAISPPSFVCLALGILAWVGLYLRDVRIRHLVWQPNPGDAAAGTR